jgi:hypothetical protein
MEDTVHVIPRGIATGLPKPEAPSDPVSTQRCKCFYSCFSSNSSHVHMYKRFKLDAINWLILGLRVSAHKK